MNKKLLAAFRICRDVADHMEQWMKAKGFSEII